MILTGAEIFNWVLAIIAIAGMYYVMKKNNTIHIGVKDKKNKIHKVPIYTNDTEEEVIKKVEKYMKKINNS